MTRDKLPKRRKKTQQKQSRVQKTDYFVLVCQKYLGVECVREYRFHPTRRWRFDYAFPRYRVAVEIDGGVWIYGRHNRPQGYIKDMEKMNAAAQMGWVVLKFTPQEKYRLTTLTALRNVINTSVHGRKT